MRCRTAPKTYAGAPPWCGAISGSEQEIGRRQQVFRHLDHALVAAHGDFAQGLIGLLLGNPPLAHDQPLGLLDGFALGKLLTGTDKLGFQDPVLLEAGIDLASYTYQNR